MNHEIASYEKGIAELNDERMKKQAQIINLEIQHADTQQGEILNGLTLRENIESLHKLRNDRKNDESEESDSDDIELAESGPTNKSAHRWYRPFWKW